MMKPSINVFTTKTLAMMSVLLIAVFAISCDENKDNSVWPGEFDTRPAPVLSSISPETEFLAGVGTLELTGQNFSSDPDENRVYFNETKAVVLEASPTRLVLRTPNLVSEEVRIRVSVVGSDLFSNTMMYRLLPTIEVPEGLRDSDTPVAVTVDGSGNIYASNLASGIIEGIVLIANGEKTEYVPPRAWRYQNLRFGPDGRLYMVRGGTFGNVYVAPAEGGPEGFFVRRLGGLADLEFDQNGFLWSGGANEGLANNFIYRIDQDENITEFTFDATIRALRIFGNDLYAGGSMGGTKGVWRFTIDANNDLGAGELYFELPAEYAAEEVRAITFDTDGNMILGITGADPVLEVKTSGGWEVVYPGVFQGDVVDISWLSGTTKMLIILDAGEGESTLYQAEMLRQGAPYYGSTN